MKLDINYNSSKHEVSVDPKFTISKVKSELEGIAMTPAKKMILQFKDKILNDKRTLDECGIQNGDELILTLIKREGGCIDINPFDDQRLRRINDK